MRIYKVLLNLTVIVCVVFITIYVFQTDSSNESTTSLFHELNRGVHLSKQYDIKKHISSSVIKYEHNTTLDYIVWCIFTKVKHKNSPLRYKFERFIHSILKHSSVVITLNVISDKNSQIIAESVIKKIVFDTGKDIKVLYQDVIYATESISNITAVMQPAFSPQHGGYYSDALFYISLGLHKLSNPEHVKAIMIDVDTEFRVDIALLFKQFDSFDDKAILALAPELSPVYQHVLYLYRSHHNKTKFGSPLGNGGFPGLNSGVILFRFDRIRASSLYETLMTQDSVNRLLKKYSFTGHLGDQDMYTLIKMEYPHLIHVLPCGWNRQLCKWWRDHGYLDVFANFSRCDEEIKIYHGNCNTPIPRQNSVKILPQ